jgi:hypothetical protein
MLHNEHLFLLQQNNTTGVGLNNTTDEADDNHTEWRSTVDGSRMAGDIQEVKFVRRAERDTTGCPATLKNATKFWSGIAGEFDGIDFAKHHKNIYKNGKPLNDVVCSTEDDRNQTRDCKRYPCQGHELEETRRTCTRYPTEKERFEALLRGLENTANMFNTMNLTYYLTAGPLIGEWRCKDLLPWSEDADIHVPVASVNQFFLNIFGKHRNHVHEDVMITHEDNPLVPKELVVWSWGWNSNYSREQPFGIADRATGFYMDVWTEEQGDTVNGTKYVERYWKHAPNKCSEREGYTAYNRFKYPKQFVYPLRNCTLHGVVHKCPRNTDSFLNIEFGAGYDHPPPQYVAALLELAG